MTDNLMTSSTLVQDLIEIVGGNTPATNTNVEQPDMSIVDYGFVLIQRIDFDKEAHAILANQLADRFELAQGAAIIYYTLARMYGEVQEYVLKERLPVAKAVLMIDSEKTTFNNRVTEITGFDLSSLWNFIQTMDKIIGEMAAVDSKYSDKENVEGVLSMKSAIKSVALQVMPYNFYTGYGAVDENLWDLVNGYLASRSYRPENTDAKCFYWSIFFSLFPEYINSTSLKTNDPQARMRAEAAQKVEIFSDVEMAKDHFYEWYEENELEQFGEPFETHNLPAIEEKLNININLYVDDGERANLYYRSRFLNTEDMITCKHSKNKMAKLVRIVYIPYYNYVKRSDRSLRYTGIEECFDDYNMVPVEAKEMMREHSLSLKPLHSKRTVPVARQTFDYGHYAVLHNTYFELPKKKVVCPYCDRAFRTEAKHILYKKHLGQCLDRIICSRNNLKERMVEYTMKSKYKQFEAMSKRYTVPFVTGDFESIIDPETLAHKAYSYCLQYVNVFEPEKSITKFYANENEATLLIQFNADLIELAKEHDKIMTYKVEHDNTEDATEARKGNCVLCERPLNKPYMTLTPQQVKSRSAKKTELYPVQYNHSHMKNDNINLHMDGFTHELCNQKAQLSNKPLKVFFHNLKNYDGSYILSAICNDPTRDIKITNVLSRGLQKFSELNVSYPGASSGKPSSDKPMVYKVLFSDSLQHLSRSLDELVGSLLKGNTAAYERIKGYFETYYDTKLGDDFIKLIQRKGIYPYRYLQIENLNAKKLPSRDWFYNDLRDSELPEKDYKEANETWDMLKKVLNKEDFSFFDYTKFYNLLDVFLLTECLTTFSTVIRKLVGINPLAFTSIASAAAGGYFFKSQKTLDLYDVEMQQLVAKNIRGGQSYCYIKKLKAEDYTTFYVDFNSLYPTVMSRFKHLRTLKGVHMPDSSIATYVDKLTTEDVLVEGSAFDKLNEGYLITCDLLPGNTTPELARLLPFQTTIDIHANMMSDYQLEICQLNKIKTPLTKTVPHFYGKKDITLSHRLFVMLKKFGYQFVIKKVYAFEMGHVYRDFLEILLDAKKKYSNDALMRNNVKLLMNSIYGSTIVNVKKFKKVEFSNNIKQLRRSACHPMFAGYGIVPTFKGFTNEIPEELVLKKPGVCSQFFSIFKDQEKVTYDYNTINGMLILDDSKVVMYSFMEHFVNKILKHYGIPIEAIKMCMSDTDSLMFGIKKEYMEPLGYEHRIDFLHDINMKISSGELPDFDSKIGCIFDLHKSDKYKELDYYKKHMEGFGLLKEENINSTSYDEFMSICSKVYYYRTSDAEGKQNEVFKSKGIMSAMMEKYMTQKSFEDVINRRIDSENNIFVRNEIRMSKYSLCQRTTGKKLMSEVDFKFIESKEDDYLIYGEKDFKQKLEQVKLRDSLFTGKIQKLTKNEKTNIIANKIAKLKSNKNE